MRFLTTIFVQEYWVSIQFSFRDLMDGCLSSISCLPNLLCHRRNDWKKSTLLGHFIIRLRWDLETIFTDLLWGILSLRSPLLYLIYLNLSNLPWVLFVLSVILIPISVRIQYTLDCLNKLCPVFFCRKWFMYGKRMTYVLWQPFVDMCILCQFKELSSSLKNVDNRSTIFVTIF